MRARMNEWPLVPLVEPTENLRRCRVPVKELVRKPEPYAVVLGAAYAVLRRAKAHSLDW